MIGQGEKLIQAPLCVLECTEGVIGKVWEGEVKEKMKELTCLCVCVCMCVCSGSDREVERV